MGFDAHDRAKEILDELKKILPRIRECDAGLAKQLRKAGQSILLNIGEGNRRTGGDRRHFFTIAAGSAGESLDAVDVAVSWGYLPDEEAREVRELLDRELAILWRLTHPK
jgi:four helix bundle protein